MTQAANMMPDILQADHGNSISILRALKNVLDVIELVPDDNWSDTNVQSAIFDIELMISKIAHGKPITIQSL